MKSHINLVTSLVLLAMASCVGLPDGAETDSDDTDVSTGSITAAGGVALLVVGGAVTMGDVMVRTRLEMLGFTVTTKTDAVVVTADATGKRLVVISSSVASAKVTNKFRKVSVPVVTWEPQILDDMGLTATNALGTRPGQTQLVIKASTTDEMTPGLSGKPTVSASSTFMWGKPAASAKIVATTTAGEAAIFRYATGAALVNLTAPARRVAFFMSDDTALGLTVQGQTLFDGAISWAAQLPRLTNAGCQTDSQCASGMCQAGLCSTRPNGTMCTANVQCTSANCVGGVCVAPQTTCRADSDCASGLACLAGVCGPRSCMSAAECPMGFVCLSATCQPGRCGDGIVSGGETCDEGTNNGGPMSRCTVDCRLKCGNGVVDAGEECDNGMNDGSYGTCTSTCILAPRCGDGIVNGPEQCDGSAGCDSSCRLLVMQ